MPYVKIPDPNIIDLAAWNEVITVVNQHSDSIAALTNDFGINYDPEWDGDNYSVQYDATSQKIIYGRALLKPSAANNGKIWHEAVTFVSPFSATPVVTATILTGNAINTSTKNADAICAVYQINQNGFNYRINRPSTDSQLTENIWVNWIAVGPR